MWFLIGFIAGTIATGIIFWAYSENVGGNTVTEETPAPTEPEAVNPDDLKLLRAGRASVERDYRQRMEWGLLVLADEDKKRIKEIDARIKELEGSQRTAQEVWP